MCTRAVSVLANYLEREGFVTAIISLIKLHTEKIGVPRGLAVPFELGRPYGAPTDAEFQKQVLKQQLKLMESPSGPVLADFDDDPPDGKPARDWTCAIELPPVFEDTDDLAGLRAAMNAEIEALRPAYEKAKARRGRTTVGVSAMNIEMASELLLAFVEDEGIRSPNPEFPLAMALKLASEDFKAYYSEAVAAEGCIASSMQIADWFWNETSGAKVMAAFKKACDEASDEKIVDMAWGVAPGGRLP